MPRVALAGLRDEVRLLISDPAGGGQRFSDDDLDRLLTRNRRIRQYDELLTSLEPGGGYRRFFAPPGWATDAAIYDDLYEQVAAVDYEADYLGGIFTFNVNRTDSVLFISGETFSVFGTARDALRAWAAALKEEIDVSASGDSWSRSQKVKNLLELANTYDAKAREEEILGAGSGGVSTLRQVRRDTRNVRGERTRPRRRIG